MMRSQTRKKIKSDGLNNILSPLTWLCAISQTLLFSLGGYYSNSWYGVACFILATFIILFYAIMFLFFALKEPDRLQSEKFILSMNQLKIKSLNPENNILDISKFNEPLVTSDESSKKKQY